MLDQCSFNAYPKNLKSKPPRKPLNAAIPMLRLPRLCVSTNSMYHWLKRYGSNNEHHQEANEKNSEIKQRQTELRQATEEHDTLKKPPHTLPENPRKKALTNRISIRPGLSTSHSRLIRVFFAWQHEPAKEDQRLLGLMKQS